MVLETVIKTVLALVLGGIYGAGIAWAKSKKTSIDAFEGAIKATVHDSYFRMCRYLLSTESDSITEADYENFEHLYQSYHSLGMNGTGDKLYEQIKNTKSITYKEIK